MSEPGLLKSSPVFQYQGDISYSTTTGVVLPHLVNTDYDEQANSDDKTINERFPAISYISDFLCKDVSETSTGKTAPKVPGIRGSRNEKYVPCLQQSQKPDWTHRLAGALLDDDNWDQIVHQAPEQVLTRWMTAKVLSQEEPIWADTQLAVGTDVHIWDYLVHQAPEQALTRWMTAKFHSPDKPVMEETRSTVGVNRLLTLLVDSPSLLRNDIYSLLVRFCTPREILEASLAQYEQTYEEQYLLQAISLLERVGKEAWTTLQWLARSERHDCELFVGLIARCEQVPVNERISAIRELAHNPHEEVRSAIFEQLSEFDEDGQRSILEILAKDDEPEIREEAEQYLAELG